MNEEVHSLAIGEALTNCPVCGNEGGFHISMTRYMGKLRIIMTCPNCHSRFDPGWCVTLEC
jgi:hypothetical protein